jgi:hypothetical protein
VENKHEYLLRIKEIVNIFDCSHIVYVGIPEIETVLSQPQSKDKAKLEIIKGLPLEGT